MFKPSMISPLLLCALPALAATEVRSTQQDQQQLAITIYNQDLALVKDLRAISLESGQQTLAFRDVSAGLRPETALLRSVNQSGKLVQIEQNFDYDLLTPQKLLEKYVGKNVEVIRTHPSTGAETTEVAQVLSANNGVVLKMGNRIETGLPGRLAFPDVPSNLRDRPTLSMLLDNQGSKQHNVELSYLTRGLSWRADYVAELNGDDTSLDLSGWVTINNESGSSYPNARIQLVAGDVRAVAEPQPRMMRDRMVAESVMMAGAEPEQEGLMEYHLYTLPNNSSLAENQIKQIALLSSSGVQTKKQLELNGEAFYFYNQIGQEQKQKFSVYLNFANTEQSNLGKPLPKGVVRVYKKDKAGNAQFVGEDHMDHTAKNDSVRLKLGEAFDVVAYKKQTDYKRISDRSAETSMQLRIKNGKSEAVTVSINEPIPGSWRILESSHKYDKTASNTASWQLTIPPEQEVTLRYTVLSTH